MPDSISKVESESLNPKKKGLSFSKKVAIGSVVAAGAVATGAILYGSGVFSSKAPVVSSTRSESDALETLVADLPTTGKLGEKDLRKLTTAFEKMTPNVQMEKLKNPKVAQLVLGNKIPMKVDKITVKQKQALEKDLLEIQQNPITPDEVRNAAKELQEAITEVKASPVQPKQPPGGGGDEVVGSKGNNSGTPNVVPTGKEDGETDQGEGKKVDLGNSIPSSGQKPTEIKGSESRKEGEGEKGEEDITPPPVKESTDIKVGESGNNKSSEKAGELEDKSENDKKKNGASKISAEVESLLAKSFNGPKDVTELLEELIKGTLVKPDGTKYVLDDIKAKCSMAPLIKPLIDAADPKTLPKVESVRNIITDVQKELKEVSDATVKSCFTEFDHADVKSTLVAHLSKDLENLKGDSLAARFALLKSIDPGTYTEDYAKTTILKNALSMTSKDLAITFKDDVELFLTDSKAVIAIIDSAKNVDKMIADATSELDRINMARLNTFIKFNSLEPSEVKVALELAAKTNNKTVEEEIKKKCKIDAFIEDLLNCDGSYFPSIDDEKIRVKEMRTKVSALADTDPIKPLYQSFLKSEPGNLFKDEVEAIEACLERDIETLTGKKLFSRYGVLKYLNASKYNADFARRIILIGALDGTPEDLAKVPDFRSFLTQRRELIRLIGACKLENVLLDAEISSLDQNNQDMVKRVLACIKDDEMIAENDYESLKTLLTNNNDLKVYDDKGDRLTLVNLAEKCSKKIFDLLQTVKIKRDKQLNNLVCVESSITQDVQIFNHNIANLKNALDQSHADIKIFHNYDATASLKEQQEDILAKDIEKLNGWRLLSRYLFLSKFVNGKYDEDFAKTKLIGNFTRDELKNDPAILSHLENKSALCYHLKFQIDGRNFREVINEVKDELKETFRNAKDDEARLKMLNDIPSMLKAALLDFLDTVTLDLVELSARDEQFTKKIDAILKDLPDRKEVVKSAIALQVAINNLSDTSASVKYAKALADYLKCKDVMKASVQMPDNKIPYKFNELVNLIDGIAAFTTFFDAILEYDEESFDNIMHHQGIHDAIKNIVLELMLSGVKGLPYARDLLDKLGKLLRNILIKEPSSTNIHPKLGPNVKTNHEAEANAIIAGHYRNELYRLLADIDTIKNFDDARLNSLIDICDSLNIKMFNYPNSSTFLLPIMTYLGNTTIAIDFTAETFDEHVPVKTFLKYWSSNPEIMLQSYNAIAEDALFGTASLNSRGLWLHKLLVPTFNLLPCIDFYALRDTDVMAFHDSLLALTSIDDDNKDYILACLEALTKDTNPSKVQNILYLWGSQKASFLIEKKRKQFESLKLVNISNEIILHARDRLLKKKAKADNEIKALYKTHYETLKQQYTGSDCEAKFPNNW